MPRVLLVHSAGPQGPGEGSEPFATRLREELGPGYEVLFPVMPNPDDPHYEPWSERLGQVLAETDGPLVVVGHSLGGSVVLKHLSERERRTDDAPGEQITGLVLAETPLWGESGWEAEWALPPDWPGDATELPPTYLFHSRDDDEIPFETLERYAQRFPGATIRPLDGNGHLLDRGDLTPIVEAIRSLAPN